MNDQDDQTPWDATRTYPDAFDDWRYEVANGDTLLGFIEWMEHNR